MSQGKSVVSAASPAPPTTPAIAPSIPPPSTSSSDDSASLSGGVARAIGVLSSSGSRILSSLYRVPLKSFRQNKFDLVSEGHEVRTPKSGLSTLVAQQGRLSVFSKQILPALIANIAVGTVMFSTFDHTMERCAEEVRKGRLPKWFVSNTLSTGAVVHHHDDGNHKLSHTSTPHFLLPYIGPDVFISGFLAGAAQTVLVTPMENSATWIRLKYRIMERQMLANAASVATTTATSSAAAASTVVTASTLEATATNFLPPVAPKDLQSLNLYSSIKEMIWRNQSYYSVPAATTTAAASSSTSTTAAATPSPSIRLFSHFSFRLTRDSFGLGVFFYGFELIHARMKSIPYLLWEEKMEEMLMHMNENSAAAATTTKAALPALTATPVSTTKAVASPTGSSSTASSAIVPSAHTSSQSHPSPLPTTLLASLLAWEVVSVLTAGIIAGTAYHVVSYPFYQTLQRRENAAAAIDATTATKTATRPISAWRDFLTHHRTHGFSSHFHGVFGERPSSSTSAASSAAAATRSLRPRLFNPLVLGLCIYTLSKSEHTTHQIHDWRMHRQEQRKQKSVKFVP